MLQYKRFFDLSADLLSIASLDGHFIQVNPAFQTILGYTEAELLAASLLDFVHPAEQAVMQKALTAETITADFETRCCCKDGSYRWLRWTLQPDDGLIYILAHDIDAEKANDAYIAAILRDISESKRVEAELRTNLERAQELNTLKTRFLSMVSHEFLTPLSIMMTSCELIRLYSDQMTSEKRLSHIEKIEAHIKYLSGLVANILTISRSETVGLDFKPATIDLNKFLRSLIDEMQVVTETHQLEFECEEDCPVTEVDTGLLRQAFINLISNAIKYSPNADRVKIALTSPERNTLDIRVQDYGIGIPEREQQLLFSTFFRASNVGAIPGTGLGLAVIQRAVNAHGGMVKLESKVGYGSTFTIRLPTLREARQDLAI